MWVFQGECAFLRLKNVWVHKKNKLFLKQGKGRCKNTSGLLDTKISIATSTRLILMHEVSQWERYEGRYFFKTKKRKFTVQLATRISVSGKRKPYKRIGEVLKMLHTTVDWTQKKWQHHSVVLLFSWREWCTLQNQLHRGEGKRCGYIKAGSQDVKSSVTNGCSPRSMIADATVCTQTFGNGLKQHVKCWIDPDLECADKESCNEVREWIPLL